MLDIGRTIIVSGLLLCLAGLVGVLLGVIKPTILFHQDKKPIKSTSVRNITKKAPTPVLCATAAFVLNYRDRDGDLTGNYDFGLIRSDLKICLLTEDTVWFYDYSNAPQNEDIRFDRHLQDHEQYRHDREYQREARETIIRLNFPSAKHIDVELFGNTKSIKTIGRQRFFVNGENYIVQLNRDGDFHWVNTSVQAVGPTLRKSLCSWLGALKAIGALNTQEDMLTLYHLSVDSDRQAPSGYSSGDLQHLIDEANYDLDRKMINAVRSLMVTALMRRSLISGIAEADATLESAMQTLTRKAENSPAGMEAKRLRDRATRTKAVLSDSLSLINEQKRRIMTCIERVREYKIQVNDRSAEALVAAEAGKAATDAVEMTIRLTGGMTSREEVDSDSILVTSIVQELETRISAFNSLVKQIRSDTSLDSDLAGTSIPMENGHPGN